MEPEIDDEDDLPDAPAEDHRPWNASTIALAVSTALANRRKNQAAGPRNLTDLAAVMGVDRSLLTPVFSGQRRMTFNFYDRLIKAMPELKKRRMALADFAQVPVVLEPGVHDWRSRRKGRACYCRICQSFLVGHLDFPCPGPPQPGVHTWGRLGDPDAVACTVCHVPLDNTRRSGNGSSPCPGPPEKPASKISDRAKAALVKTREAYEKKLELRRSEPAKPTAPPADISEYSPLIFPRPGSGPRKSRRGRPPTQDTANLVDIFLYMARCAVPHAMGVIGVKPLALFLPHLRQTLYCGFVPPALGQIERYADRVAKAERLSTFHIVQAKGKELVVFARSQAHLQAWMDAHNIVPAPTPPDLRSDRGPVSCHRNFSGERITLPGYHAAPVIYDEATGDVTPVFLDDQ